MNIRGHLSYAQIAEGKGNQHFQADLFESSATININPFLLFSYYDGSQKKLFPSIIVGVSLAHYNSLLKDGDNVMARGFGKVGGLFGYVIEGVAIGGVGLSYALNDQWNIRVELANRWMSEDNLDSKVSRSKYDFYNFTIISFGYKFARRSPYMFNEKPYMIKGRRTPPNRRW